jgi:hypothetical protein
MKFVRTYFEIMDLLESIINTEDADEKDVVLATMAKSMIASRLISQNKPFELRKYAENIVIQTDGKSYVFDEETMRAMDQLLSVDQEEKQEEKPVDTTQSQKHDMQETTEEKEDKQEEASNESKQDEEVNIPQQAVSEHPLSQDETNEAENEVNNETFNPEETRYEPDMPTFMSEDNDPFSSDSSVNTPLLSDGLNFPDEPANYDDPSSSNTNETKDTPVQNEEVPKNVLLHPERMDIKIKQKDIMYAYVKGNFTDENGEPLSRVDMFVTPLATSIHTPEFIVRYVIDRNADKQLMADALGESPEAIISDGKGNSLKVTCSISEEGVLQPMVEGISGSEFVIAAIKDEGLHGKGHLETYDDATGISVRMFPSGKKNEANGHAKFAYCVFKHDQLVDIGYSTGEPISVNNNGEMLKFACKWNETDNPSENVAEVEMFDYGRKQ